MLEQVNEMLTEFLPGKNSKCIYPNKWLKFCKSVEDKVPLFEEEDTISAEMGWNTKQEFGYIPESVDLWIYFYQKTNFHEYSREVFGKLKTWSWIWLLESTTWLSVFVFIFFGGSEYQKESTWLLSLFRGKNETTASTISLL